MAWKIRDFSKLNTSLIDEAWSVFKDSTPAKGEKRTLRLETIATHSGKVINKRVYPGVFVKDAAKSFFINDEGAKYNKPFLKNHNPESEPIGRVVKADYKQTVTGKRFLADALMPLDDGSGYTKITSHIMDEDAIEKFLDGRYATVSVAGGTDGAFCSVCTHKTGKLHPMWSEIKNSDGESDRCQHQPGQTYGEFKCHLITGSLHYKEVSQVNIPADDGAVHTMKEIMVKDSEGGCDNIFDFTKDQDDSDIFMDSAPAVFSIVDADGNVITSLGTDTYKSTKSIYIPKPGENLEDGADDNIEGDNKENKDQINKLDDESNESHTITDEVFASAHILKHFSDLGMLKLSDIQKEEVKLLQDKKLTEDQSRIMKEPFITHPSIPFKVQDKAHYEVMLQLISDGDLDVDKERFMDALRKQAQVEQLTLDNEVTKMEKEALMKALADAQKTVETLEAAAITKDKTITDMTAAKTADDKTIGELKDSLHTDRVVKIIELRTELGYADTAMLKDKAKKEETLKTLTDKYTAMDANVLGVMLGDLNDQKQAGGFKTADTSSVVNPLEDKDDDKDQEENKRIADAEAKKIADKASDKTNISVW